jgi:hypothetical protein
MRNARTSAGALSSAHASSPGGRALAAATASSLRPSGRHCIPRRRTRPRCATRLVADHPCQPTPRRRRASSSQRSMSSSPADGAARNAGTEEPTRRRSALSRTSRRTSVAARSSRAVSAAGATVVPHAEHSSASSARQRDTSRRAGRRTYRTPGKRRWRRDCRAASGQRRRPRPGDHWIPRERRATGAHFLQRTWRSGGCLGDRRADRAPTSPMPSRSGALASSVLRNPPRTCRRAAIAAVCGSPCSRGHAPNCTSASALRTSSECAIATVGSTQRSHTLAPQSLCDDQQQRRREQLAIDAELVRRVTAPTEIVRVQRSRARDTRSARLGCDLCRLVVAEFLPTKDDVRVLTKDRRSAFAKSWGPPGVVHSV